LYDIGHADTLSTTDLASRAVVPLDATALRFLHAANSLASSRESLRATGRSRSVDWAAEYRLMKVLEEYALAVLVEPVGAFVDKHEQAAAVRHLSKTLTRCERETCNAIARTLTDSLCR